MGVVRKIGAHEFLVNPNEPCGIYLEESLVDELNVSGATLTKKQLLKLLASGDDYFPLTTRWELLDRCNFSCPFCYIVGHSFNKIVRFSEIKAHVSELIDDGLLFCTLTGGEATIHPDFETIYRFLKENGVVVEVFTNGHSIDDRIIETFKEYPPQVVEVSLYTTSDRRFRDIYGSPSSHPASQVLTNVLKLQRSGIKVMCKTFLNTITVEDIGEIKNWCKRHEIEHYSSSDFTKAYDGTELSQYAVQTDNGINHVANAVCLPCITKNCGSAINSSFCINPCPSIVLQDCLYDIRQIGVKESLSRMKAFMRRFQDAEIHNHKNGAPGCASCMAYANPVRGKDGQILYFAQP